MLGGVVLVSMCDMDAENWTAGPGFFPNGVAGVSTIICSICSMLSFELFDIALMCACSFSLDTKFLINHLGGY